MGCAPASSARHSTDAAAVEYASEQPLGRGGACRPRLLSEIVRRECPPATRLWIIHAPENLPSGIGISRAGFEPVAELSFDAAGEPLLAPVGGPGRALAAAELLGLPLVQGELDPCWACGGCSCDHDHSPGAAHSCACATAPRQGEFRPDHHSATMAPAPTPNSPPAGDY